MKKSELIFFPSWMAGRAGYADRIRELFHEYLRSRDLSVTTQRTAILNHLLAAERHLTQEEIYAALKGRGIGKVTVFRALKTLEESGLVERVSDAEGTTRYEVKRERPHHDHLICESCGGITEVQWPEVERAQEKVCRALHFTVNRHRHEVYGRCGECAARA